MSVPREQAAVVPDRFAAEWLAPALMGDPPQPSGQGLGPYLHALRRRWLVSATFGTLGAIALAWAAWYFYTPEYTAEAFLQVSSTEQRVLFPTIDPVTQFDIYRDTQQQILKLPHVLVGALRQPGIANLPTVGKQPDQEAWLQGKLVVDFPGQAEIMRVSMKGKNKTEVRALVDAVVVQYMDEVQGNEMLDRSKRERELSNLQDSKLVELRDSRNRLRQLVDQLGTGNSETLTLKQQNILQQFFEFRREWASVQFERMRAERKLEIQQKWLERTSAMPLTDGELEWTTAQKVDLAMQSDRLATMLFVAQTELQSQLATIDVIAKPQVAEKHRARQDRQLAAVNEQLAARREEVKEELRQQKLATVKEEILSLEIEIDVLRKHEGELARNADQIREQAEKLGGSSIDIEMMQGEIKLLEELVSNVGQELQKTEIEKNAQQRVKRVGPARAAESNRNLRIALVALAATSGFFFPVGAIAWWDTRSRRINSFADVPRQIGLDVIGTVPIIPSRVARRLGALPRRHQFWQTMLDESVDGIAARLLHQAEQDQTRVILVSSAVENEAKTTIASQLALSLARTGRRTVLVDFDLRRPAIDAVFGLPCEPGVGDVLRRQSNINEVIHRGGSDNLDVITAGRWDAGAVRVLANGVTAPFLKELRSEYDFVLLDAGPILPVVDTRIISQHVDGVVLSILCDVSQAPKIIAAHEILDAFGVRTLGVVVTGTATEVYSGSYKHLSHASS